MVKRSKPTVAVLSNLYKTIQETIKDKDAYYTQEQIEALKKNPNNKFIQLNTKGGKYGND